MGGGLHTDLERVDVLDRGDRRPQPPIQFGSFATTLQPGTGRCEPYGENNPDRGDDGSSEGEPLLTGWCR